ncbi:hypothetical protein B0H15DRAFT_807915, partial [Mycena belliarum]
MLFNGIWTDMRACDLEEMKQREQKLRSFAQTFVPSMLDNYSHREWALKLNRLADSIPDTHGLMIEEVWKCLPLHLRNQISRRYDNWRDFTLAIYRLAPDKVAVREILPVPWHKKSQPGMDGIDFSCPSACKLAICLNRYAPRVWRGRNPDKEGTQIFSPSPLDRAQADDPWAGLTASLQRLKMFNSELHSKAYGIHNILESCIREHQFDQNSLPTIEAWLSIESLKNSLTSDLVKYIPRLRRCVDFFPDLALLWMHRLNYLDSFRARLVKNKDVGLHSLLTLAGSIASAEYYFDGVINDMVAQLLVVTSPSAPSTPSMPASSSMLDSSLASSAAAVASSSSSKSKLGRSISKSKSKLGRDARSDLKQSTLLSAAFKFSVAGISRKMADFGVPRWKAPDAGNVLNDPEWDPVEAAEETEMEFIGVEWDPRDLILNMKTCFLEIFTSQEWIGVSRRPDH